MSTAPDVIADTVFPPAATVSEAVFTRRSVRNFRADPVPLDESITFSGF